MPAFVKVDIEGSEIEVARPDHGQQAVGHERLRVQDRRLKQAEALTHAQRKAEHHGRADQDGPFLVGCELRGVHLEIAPIMACILPSESAFYHPARGQC